MPNQPLLPIVSYPSIRKFNFLAVITALIAVYSGVGGQYTYAGPPPPEPPEYEVTVIPGPYCGIFGYEPANGWGINDLGNICGDERNCAIDWEPFFWSPETGRVVLEVPAGFDQGRALDLNSKNQIVGQLRMNNVNHAMLWENGEVIELGTGHGGNYSQALAINSLRQITGTWGNSAVGPIHGFLWQDGVFTNLAEDLGTPNSRANDNNELGQITGWMGTSLIADGSAYIWDNGNITDLGVIPGGFTGMGMAINNHGDVAVQGLTFNDNKELIVRSFLWRSGQWIDIGVLPGFDITRVVDINDNGQVIGNCELLDTNNIDPFLWEDGVMWNLTEYWVSDDPEFSGISRVRAMSNTGSIAGTGVHQEFGTSAIRLLPVLPILGDLDGDGDVNTTDLLILLGSWGPCALCTDCPADLDDNCIVSVSDLLMLFANWG